MTAILLLHVLLSPKMPTSSARIRIFVVDVWNRGECHIMNVVDVAEHVVMNVKPTA